MRQIVALVDISYKKSHLISIDLPGMFFAYKTCNKNKSMEKKSLTDRSTYNRDYRKNYGEKMKEQIRRWFENHPDYRKIYNKKWYQKNGNYHKAWQLENSKHYKNYQKKWNRQNQMSKSLYMRFYMRKYRTIMLEIKKKHPTCDLLICYYN
jgi:hypothetical protein